MVIEHNRPQFEEVGAAESILAVDVGTSQDLGGSDVRQGVAVLDAVRSGVRSEQVAVEAMTSDVVFRHLSVLTQIAHS